LNAHTSMMIVSQLIISLNGSARSGMRTHPATPTPVMVSSMDIATGRTNSLGGGGS